MCKSGLFLELMILLIYFWLNIFMVKYIYYQYQKIRSLLVAIGHIIYPDMKCINPSVIYNLSGLVCRCDLEVWL